MNQLLYPTAGCKLIEIKARGARGLGGWVSKPQQPSREPPLVAVHGIRRRARLHAEVYAGLAARFGRVVVAPHFREDTWPNFQRIGSKSRSDIALINFLDELAVRNLLPTGGNHRFELVGYSAGAQFAHRFAMLHPLRIARLVVTAAGWYTFPSDAPYPYGLAGKNGQREGIGPKMALALREFLRIPIDVCVGGLDRERDANLRAGSADIDRQQGRNRVERARNWHAAISAIHLRPGDKPGFHVLDGCGHGFEECMSIGSLGQITISSEAAHAISVDELTKSNSFRFGTQDAFGQTRVRHIY